MLDKSQITTQGSSSVPKGTILPWYGNLSSIPSGFLLCNGTNGTPNLLDRFLVGAGANYVLGDIGGETFHQLTITEMPNHNHTQGSESLYNFYGGGYYIGGGHLNGTGSFAIYSHQYTSSTGGNLPHENRPPYFSVYYIMKI